VSLTVLLKGQSVAALFHKTWHLATRQKARCRLLPLATDILLRLLSTPFVAVKAKSRLGRRVFLGDAVGTGQQENGSFERASSGCCLHSGNRACFAKSSNTHLKDRVVLVLSALALIICIFATGSAATGHAVRRTQETRAQSHLRLGDTTQSYNRRLLRLASEGALDPGSPVDYQIGPGDLLQISVYSVSDLDRTVQVSGRGRITLPLIGDVQASGLTAGQLESQIESRLWRGYMVNPQVTVFVKEVKSHAISVLGAVGKPGVYQIQQPESLIEVLCMAQGLADDAGDKIIVTRQNESAARGSANLPNPRDVAAADSLNAPARPEPFVLQPPTRGKSLQIDVKRLLSSANPANDIEVYPGDAVKVPRAGIVYVVGEVRKPGGFLLRTNENISVLQALALAQGTTGTSNEKGARIIRNAKEGARKQIAINLKRILAGKAADPLLHAGDILFIPNSAGKSVFYRGAEAAVSITGGLIVYRW